MRVQRFPVGKLIERTMIEKGITREQISNETGLTTSQIEKIINGGITLMPDKRILIARSLNISSKLMANFQALYEEWEFEERCIKHFNSNYIKFINKDFKISDDLIANLNIVEDNETKMEKFVTSNNLSFRKFNTDFNKKFIWIKYFDYLINKLNDSNYFEGSDLEVNSESIDSAMKSLKIIIANTTNYEEAPNLVREHLKEYGINMFYVDEIVKTNIHGGIRKKGNDIYIGISKKYTRFDRFIFTVFHELFHYKEYFKKPKLGGFDICDEEEESIIDKKVRNYLCHFDDEQINIIANDNELLNKMNDYEINKYILLGMHQYASKSYNEKQWDFKHVRFEEIKEW